MSRKTSLLITLLVSLAVIAVVAWLVKTRPKPSGERRPMPPPVVELTPLARATLQPVDRVSGLLQPARRARLHFQLSGELVERRVDAGVAVAAGDLLARLDDADEAADAHNAEVAVAEERAAVARDRRLLKLAREQVALAEHEVARQRSLGKQSLASRAGLDRARTASLRQRTEVARLEYAVSTAEQRLARKRIALEKAMRRLARTRLRAPWAGEVARVAVEVGDYLTPATLAVELIDVAELELRVHVGVDSIAALAPGREVEVRIGDRRRVGRIRSLARVPEADSGTYPVRIRLAGDGLVAGQLGRVALPLRARVDVLVAPASAILRDEGKTWLFVFHDDGGGRGHLERRAVRLGVRVGDLVELLSGAKPGERVVARDVAFLSDAQPAEARGAQ